MNADGHIPRDFAAPEGWHPSQADLFSFGKTLYEMYTGLPVKEFPRLPPELLHWEDHQTVLRLNRVVGRACAPDRRHCYQCAEALLSDLEHIEWSSES